MPKFEGIQSGFGGFLMESLNGFILNHIPFLLGSTSRYLICEPKIRIGASLYLVSALTHIEQITNLRVREFYIRTKKYLQTTQE